MDFGRVSNLSSITVAVLSVIPAKGLLSELKR